MSSDASHRLRRPFSALLKNPSQLTGRDVVVIGGGVWAYDLLHLGFEQRARRVMWVHLALRWMVPTRKPKHQAGGIRARMIGNFNQIDRHRGEVLSLQGRSITLADAASIEADVILWATGYEVDLRFLDSPAPAGAKHLNQLTRRRGALLGSLDRPKFCLAVILETTGSAPRAYAHAARTIAGHIRGVAELNAVKVAANINHYSLVHFLAQHDPVNYPANSWHGAYRELALAWPDHRSMPIP